ncbi:MAG: carbohydrate-binding family V/XII, partial [Actinobacteria bacterium]
MEVLSVNHVKRAACRCSIAWSVLAALLISSSVRADEEEAWPREIETPQGLVVIYQPQLDRLEGNTLEVRAAVSVAPTGESEPTFGVVWFKAHLDTDFDGRTVVLRDVVVPSVKFQGATPEQQQALVDLLNTEIPKWDLEMSLDRMVALLDLAEKQAQVAEGFDDTPPTILFADYPAVLVAIDGAPSLLQIPNTELRIVINTPFLIMEDLKDQHFYLYAGNEAWYDASAIEGPWRVTERVPARVLEMQPLEKLETEGEIPDEFMGSTVFPKIIVATEATELIVTDGPPRFRPIGSGELSHLSNTKSDVLLESATQRYFVLLSGRWFSSESLNGPWVFVASDALPPSFAEIPPDSDQGYLLTWVAGTQLAKDAVLESYIPQTASVPRDVTIKVIYDGAPQFEAIEETNLEYAVNTQFQVIKSGAMYYCLHEAVWYMASAPSGPWSVASEVPEEIYDIPPSSPLYNTTFVFIYESTPDEEYVGYYPGYVSSYVYNGCVVYGTGWRYRAYVSPRRCYPRHATW